MNILFFYVRRYWKRSLLVLVLALVNQVASLIDPLIFQRIIDQYANNFSAYTQAEFFRGVGGLLLLAIGVVFISRVAKNLQDYFLNEVTQRAGADMYQDGVKHSLALPYEVFEDQRSGETLGILQKARADSEKFIAAVINIVFISLIGFIFVTVYAVTVYWGVAVLYAATIPLIGGVGYVLTKKLKRVQTQIVDETTALAGSTTESLRNIELVKSLGLVDQEIGRLNATTEKILALELKKLRYVRSISFVQGTLVNLMRNAILLFLLYLVFTKTITFGQFFSLYIYSFFIFGPLGELGTVITAYRDVQVSLKKYKEMRDIPKESLPSHPKELGSLQNIEFKNVSFLYKSSEEKALDGISFSIKKGKTIAFVGPSGSGKTSLVKLLVGLYDSTDGEIYYNSTPRGAIDLSELRKHIGFVTQDTQLFAGTIKENLLFVNPTATDEEVLDVLHRSAAESLLARASDGINTMIGEGGVKISGGEKQRLSIARALLRKPSLLVFDEATSALDSLTEQSITKTIQTLSQTHRDMMIVLIAHRLSTVMHADTIYVLEKGTFVESGTHESLLEKRGLYYAMWRQQIGER